MLCALQKLGCMKEYNYNSELFDDRYDIYRCDRDRAYTGLSRGGGTFVAVKPKFRSSQVKIDTHLDTVIIKLHAFGQNFYVSKVYFTPNSPLEKYSE